jgi:hypothetical protein
MPIYFGPVAPSCPISRDRPLAPATSHLFGRPQFVRPAIPRAFDLPSAINAANIARNIVQSLTSQKTVNNVYSNTFGKKFQPFIAVAPDKYNNKIARWVEQTSKRVKRKYKYYAKDDNGEKDMDNWVIMERIERMVWYDRAWKSYLIWTYGTKDDAGASKGVPVVPRTDKTAEELANG